MKPPIEDLYELSFWQLRGKWVELSARCRSNADEVLMWRIEDELNRICSPLAIDWRLGEEPAIN